MQYLKISRLRWASLRV